MVFLASNLAFPDENLPTKKISRHSPKFKRGSCPCDPCH